MTTTTARTVRARLARAEAAHRAALAARHKIQCRRLGLPLTATEGEVLDEFGRRLAGIVRRCEREHGTVTPAALIPGTRCLASGDTLDTLDDAAFLVYLKAVLHFDGYLPQE